MALYVDEVMVVLKKSWSGEGKPRSLWRIVHDDEKGGVSVETVLILAAVALPVLIFLYKVVIPGIIEWWKENETILKEEAGEVTR